MVVKQRTLLQAALEGDDWVSVPVRGNGRETHSEYEIGVF